LNEVDLNSDNIVIDSIFIDRVAKQV